MGTIEIEMDRGLFTPDVIARTAHRYTADYFVEVSAAGGSIVVRLTPKGPSVDTEHLAQRFCNDALDDRLRAAVAEQTTELHTALVRAALGEAQPRDASA
ncbi:hypothetical protein [Lysobacter niastensis]|uniref:His-Xaa-Ser system protein HxsD n=1 Tax=Lysobacter niastensis TaxID=380629 RepID=A0ABS0BAW9_9GAMM|nr:hypothetical protein [Lysobacter niastensis]MBF6024814.1 hypothetical protein [Lysobacter niastensis]